MTKPILITNLLLLLSPLINAATLLNTQQASSLTLYSSGLTTVHEKKWLKISSNEHNISYDGLSNSVMPDSINLNLPKELLLNSQHFKPAPKRSSDEAPLEKTSLLLDVSTKKDIQTPLTLSYLLQDISLRVHYRALIEDKELYLKGFVSIENESEQSFLGANVSLLLGESNRVNHSKPVLMYARSSEALPSPSEQETKEGYTLYKLKKPLNIPSKSVTQVAFMEPLQTKFQRELVATLSYPLYLQADQEHKVSQKITLDALSQTLPRGVLRAFTALDGKEILLGETEIAQNSKMQKLSFTLGYADDISVKEELIEKEQTPEYHRSHVRYSVFNASLKPQEITLEIPFTKEKSATIKSELPHRFTKGNFVTFSVLVEAGKTKSFDVHFQSRK